MKFTFSLLLLSISPFLFAQKAEISGLVYNATNKQPLAGAHVRVQELEEGGTTDSSGRFSFWVGKSGLYNLEISHTSFENYVEYEVKASSIKPVYIEVGLIPSAYSLGEVTVSDDAKEHAILSPLSVKKLNWSEVQRMAGATLDISKAIQSYPGIIPRSSFGYNLVFRGGAPHENSYFLDGIKIPAITHFGVQGASGGPNGLVNLDFVRDINLYSSSFPAQYGNTLSGMVEIEQRDARKDRWGSRITLGATDFGATVEGPIGDKVGLIASARHSFSQHLLQVFNVPVLPTYTDAQFRAKYRMDDKNELIVTGLMGFDKYRLNTEAPESDALLYNIGYIPEGEQQVYALGAHYKHYLPNSFYSFVVSQNGFTNDADKFKNNSGLEKDRLMKYRSAETETRVRFEHNIYKNEWEFKYGLNAVSRRADFESFSYRIIDSIATTTEFKGDNEFLQYGAFASLARRLLNDKLGVKFALRADAANLNERTADVFDHLSPLLEANYLFHKNLSFKASTGIFHQLPPQILLTRNQYSTEGHSDFISARHLTAGFEYQNRKTYKASAEFFFKDYQNYPWLLHDDISFGNALAEYVVIGNQPSLPISEGRAYGLELHIQQKLKHDYWWMLSYTYSQSEFEGRNGELIPSSWDTRHFAMLNIGKVLKRNWQISMRWRYGSGIPYTPYEQETSSLTSNWDVINRGVFDFSETNSLRLPSFHQGDLRFDKNWYFNKWNLNLFIDIQNFYRSAIPLTPYLTQVYDEEWSPLLTDNGRRYELQTISSDTGRTLYTIGLVADF